MSDNKLLTDTARRPPNAGKGRGKGNKNKATLAIKEMIEGALSDVGGRKYLAQQAIENPSAFMGLVGKILPKDVNVGGQADNPLTVSIKPHPELTPEQWAATFGPK